MKAFLKSFFSKRAIIVVSLALLALTILNTCLIWEGVRQTNAAYVVNYDFVLSQDGGNYKLKNMLTGDVAGQPKQASLALATVFENSKSVYINPGTYELTEDIYITNKLGAKIVSDGGATIQGNGHRIVVYGDDYTFSQYAYISGLTLINCTLRVENSFATTIANMRFINSSTGIEFINTNTWSEYNKVESCQFINNTEGIAFRTPINGTQIGNDIIGNATGSYASSIIERCSFTIQDFSVGINVEQLAEFSDSQLQNIRFWMGENEQRSNQTALRVDGSMYQTLLLGVVFESFTPDPIYMFAIDIDGNCDPTPILNSVSFLGNWTTPIHNPFAIWLSGSETIFKRETTAPIGTKGSFGNPQTIECRPLIISSFKPKIEITGNFSQNETITVRIRAEYIDKTISAPITHSFTTAGSTWVTDAELTQLFTSQNIIWAILVDAKVDSTTTDATVKVSGYGISG
jgi:hypothetical protein